MVASEGTESSVSALTRSKRTRREDAGGDLGRAEEESHVPQVEAGEVESGATELDRPGVVAVDATADAAVTAEAGLAWTEGTVMTEIIMSRPATDEVVAGKVAVIDACSGPAGRENLHEVVEEAAKEASAGVRESEPSEMVVQASSGPGPMPGAKADTLVPGTEIGVAADPLLFGATSSPEKVSQGLTLVGRWRTSAAKIPQLPGLRPKALQGGRTSQLRSGLVLAARVSPASSRRSGRILLPASGLVEAVEPRAIS
jgi:hypothetical protein